MTLGTSVIRVTAFLVTAIALAAMSRLSAIPVDSGARGSLLRLSWNARPERIETCRALSEEELEEREEHMRQRVECEGRFATYDLSVMIDGLTVHRSIVRGAGLRHDRPIYLLRDILVTPGVHRVQVTFRRREKTDDDAGAFMRPSGLRPDTGIFAGRAEREAVEHARRARAAIPPLMVLNETLTFASNRLTMVTLDGERAEFVVLQKEPKLD